MHTAISATKNDWLIGWSLSAVNLWQPSLKHLGILCRVCRVAGRIKKIASQSLRYAVVGVRILHHHNLAGKHCAGDDDWGSTGCGDDDVSYFRIYLCHGCPSGLAAESIFIDWER